MLQKGTTALLCMILMISCLNNTAREYDEEFYKPLPFEGMKGKVKSITSTMSYSPQFNSSETDESPEQIFYILKYFFDEKGRIDSVFSIQYEDQDTIVSSIKQIWGKDFIKKTIEKQENSFKKKILETIVQRNNEDSFTLFTKDLLDSTNVIPNGSIKIDFEKKKMTTLSASTSLKEDGNEIKSNIQYYQNRRVIKSETRDENKGLTITYTDYNDDGNVKENRYINNAEKSPQKARNRFEYLEIDKQGNYTLNRSIYQGNDSDIDVEFSEAREITYWN